MNEQENLDVVLPIRITNRFQNAGYLLNCLNSLEQTVKRTRLIFVDDNSDKDFWPLLDQLVERFRGSVMIRTGFQRWWTRAVNLGLRLVRTEKVLILNTDVVFEGGWLEELQAVWVEAETILGKRVGLVGSEYSERELRRWVPTHGPDYVTGHALLCSMAAIHDVANARGTPGIFLDELRQDAIHIRSDNYLCYDMNKLDWVTVKSFKSNVGHFGGKSWGHKLMEIHTLPLSAVSEKWL